MKDGIEKSGDEKLTAEFTSHYNAKLNTCFYLLTVASGSTLKRMLFDVNGGEIPLPQDPVQGKGDHGEVTYTKLLEADHGHVKASGPGATFRHPMRAPNPALAISPRAWVSTVSSTSIPQMYPAP